RPDVGVGDGEIKITGRWSGQAALVVREVDRADGGRHERLAAEGVGRRVRCTWHEAAVDANAQASEHHFGCDAVRYRPRRATEGTFERNTEVGSEGATADPIDAGGRAVVEDLVGEVGREHDGQRRIWKSTGRDEPARIGGVVVEA